jgi:hypothetical protein
LAAGADASTLSNGSAAPSALGLGPRHLDDPRKSALTDATIQACGFRSLREGENLRDAQGHFIEHDRLKPERPRRDQRGKPIKDQAPKGRPHRLTSALSTPAARADSAPPRAIPGGEQPAQSCDAPTRPQEMIDLGVSDLPDHPEETPPTPVGIGEA